MRRLVRSLKSHRGAISIVSLLAVFVYFFIVDTTLNSPSTTNPLLKSSKTILSSKSLIVASLKDDDTSWIRKHLADWHANIYVVDDPRAELTVPLNKGREAMVYLTYIIDNYDKLPDIMVFIHGKRYQWHNDDPIYDSVPILTSLRLPHVYSVGYAPLRCAWVPGCPDEIHPLNPSLASITINPSEEVPNRLKAEAAYASAYQEIFPNAPVPSVVGAPCSSQFAVTRERVRVRGKAEYERVRRWLVETELEDRVAGRVLEYLWHIIMQMPPVYCPPAAECYCMTFGLCTLTCNSVARCENRYILPTYAEMPEGWPERGGGENGWPVPGWNE